MKEINLLTCWYYGIDNQPFYYFLNELNVKKCHCIQMDENANAIDERIILLNLSNPIDYYSEASIEIELDDRIVNLMKPYEQMCFDVINRWRRSYTFKSSYRELRRLYYIYLRYWNDYIIKNQINLMVINLVPHCINEFIPYAVCRAYSIPTILQGNMPFIKGEKTNYILRPNTDEFDHNLKNRYNNTQRGYDNKNCKNFLLPFLSNYFYLCDSTKKNNSKVVFYNEKRSIFETMKDYKERACKYLKRGDIKILLNKVTYLFKVRMETSAFLKRVSSIEEDPDFDNNFILFCLQLQPEATTIPAGGNYADQLMAIRLIASCLPDNMFLYVKEHPAYWTQKNRIESVYESRDMTFYRDIKRLKNVKLINHRISSEDLMEKCIAIATINGTVGFEALFKGIPVITFAATFYEEYPSVYRIREKNDCQRALEAICKSVYKYEKKEIENLLVSVQKYVIPMGMFEQNFLDNGVPEVDDEDRFFLVKKIIEFYKEYYCKTC